MPNWCDASYRFEGNKIEITDLYQKLKSIADNYLLEPQLDFGSDYIGNVITIFGGNINDFDCQGTLDSAELLDDTTLYVSTCTGWRERNEIWNFVIEKYPSIKYYFKAEEPGCNYFVTNDVEGKYYPERFQVEQYDLEAKLYNTLKEVYADVSKRLDVSISNKKELSAALKLFNKAHKDDWVRVDKYKIVLPQKLPK